MYDILIELIRAKMLKNGFKAQGDGAHEARSFVYEKKLVLVKQMFLL